MANYGVVHYLKSLLISLKDYSVTTFRHLTKIDFMDVINSVWSTLERQDNFIWIAIIMMIGLSIWILKAQHYWHAFFRARNCQVSINWNEATPNQVGGNVLIAISFFEVPSPENIRDILQSVTVKVKLDEEEIVVVKTTGEQSSMIYARFKADRAGKYMVHILYEGFPVAGSPFSANIEAANLDPSMSRIAVKNPIVLTLGHQLKLDIQPFDTYGNRCSTTNDDHLRLTLEIKKFLGRDSEAVDVDFGSRDFQYSFGVRQELENPMSFLSCYTVHVKSLSVGNFIGNVCHDGIPLTLPSPTLEFICISVNEETMLKEFEYTSSATFTAKRVTDYETLNKNQETLTDVTLDLSPKFFYLNYELYGNLLTSRISTLRLGVDCKLEVLSIEDSPESGMYCMEIKESIQNVTERIKMPGPYARVFMILFSKYCSYPEVGSTSASPIMEYSNGTFKSNNLLSIDTKTKSLYKGIRELYSSSGSSSLPHPQLNTFTSSSRMKFKLLKVRRSEIIETTLKETQHFTREDWGKPFIVSFYGEPVNSDKLAWLEWSEILLSMFLENNAHGMFCTFGSSSFIHPNPNRNSRWKKEHYELAGKIVGKYLVETALEKDDTQGYFTDARFTRSFLAQILSVMPNYKHMEFDDPEEYFSTIVPIINQDVNEMHMNFTGPSYDQYGNIHMRELILNGQNVAVTNENKFEYLNALAKLRLRLNVQVEIEEFISGLTVLVPEDLLMKFDENELELVLCGSSGITTKEMQLYHISSGKEWNPYLGRIKNWLWKSLTKMSPMDIGRFLQFVTGSSRLPKGGFKELRPRLKISVSSLYGQLPSVNRALHHLCLTDHTSFELFHNSLITAIQVPGTNYSKNHF